jgi:hypothetical protein
MVGWTFMSVAWPSISDMNVQATGIAVVDRAHL